MAYYGSSLYLQGDVGEYHQTPYCTSYDVVPFQGSIPHSDYEFSDSKFIEYEPTDYRGAYHSFPILSEIHESTYNGVHVYDPFPTQSEIHYSTYNFSVPKLIEYNPNPNGTGYLSSETHYVVSYSATEFNEPDFVDYDPTPYGGGYDIAQTYGKPLLPSDEICYPRSGSETNGHHKSTDDDTKDQSLVPKPVNESKPSRDVEEEKQHNGQDKGSQGNGGQFERALDLNHGDEERGGQTYDDNYPWSGYGYGHGHGHEKQVGQVPYGSGLEAMDLCESLFGYWPCLSRRNRRGYGCREVADEESRENQWQSAADYLFGSDPRYGGHSYGCERHYQEQPYYQQVGCDENSWLQHLNIFENSNKPW